MRPARVYIIENRATRATDSHGEPLSGTTIFETPVDAGGPLPFVILSCAADAFFCVPAFGDSPSFFACFNENNLIMLGSGASPLCDEAYK